MNFGDLQNEDQRLAILELLAQDRGGYTLNESMLQSGMGYVGHKCSRDCIRTHLFWLGEQCLVTLDERPGFYVATLTARGLDCATGAAVVPGVKRPAPGV